MAAKKADLGRITFPKNPWPKGHRIAELVWGGRVEADSVWFDLHLVSANYDEDDKRASDEDDDDDDGGEWRSKATWTNYGRCTISSTKWEGVATGFRAGTPKKPLDFAKLGATLFKFDRKSKRDDEKPAFHIYLTGHDAVADHRITFTKTRTPKQYSLSWKGRVCLAYIGRKTYDYRFEVVTPRVVFAGFRRAPGVSAATAKAVLAACVRPTLG